MALHTLLYSSTATYEMEEKNLLDILSVAREFNAAHGITGLLLYHAGAFMQVLEGEKDAIFDLYDRIVADERHAGLHLAFHEPIEERSFRNWAMGFRSSEQLDTTRLEGFTAFFDEDFKNESGTVQASMARRFIHLFVSEAA